MNNEIIVAIDENTAMRTLRNLGEAKAYEFNDLVHRAYKDKPDKRDIEGLQRWLDENPEIWRLVFDLSYVIEKNLINRMVPNRAAQLAIEKNAEELRTNLAYEAAPFLEKLLINNIVIAWLRHQWTEYYLTIYMGQDGVSLSVIAFWEKRSSVSQHRFLRACETLEKIRKLSAKNPTLQVNIATQNGQQVNIVGDIVKN